ncbi:MAG TPA: hypothetical protein VGF51_08785 [Acidimicrobiales bacterium]|jgi:ABC-type proline/glycine betaine transport system permease subunit
MVFDTVVASLIDLGGTGHYVHWGFIQISIANLVVIALMIVVLILAILLPFPRHGKRNR